MQHPHRSLSRLARISAVFATALSLCAPADAARGLSFGRIFGLDAAAAPFGAVSSAIFGLRAPVAMEPLGRFVAGAPAAPAPRVRIAAPHLSAPAATASFAPSTVAATALRAADPRPAHFAFWQSAVSPVLERAVAAPAADGGAFAVSSPVPAASAPHTLRVPAPDVAASAATFTTPVRIGGATLTSSVLVQHLQERRLDAVARPSLDRLGAGVSFPVPVLGTHVALNLDADLEHVNRRDGAAYPNLALDAAGQPGSQAVPDTTAATRYFPNYVDVVHSTLGAGASLSVSRDVVVSASYNTQGYRGSYGTIGQSLTERKDQYQGTVTYKLPKSGSSVTVLFQNQQYHDPVLPTYNFNTNREDLKFTVRF